MYSIRMLVLHKQLIKLPTGLVNFNGNSHVGRVKTLKFPDKPRQQGGGLLCYNFLCCYVRIVVAPLL